MPDAPCRCCCPQIPLINNSPNATTVKVSPGGNIVWYYDSGILQNAGHLNGDRYFALGSAFSGATFTRARMSLLGLDGSVFNDQELTSTEAIHLGPNNGGVGSAALASGGIAFVGYTSGASSTNRLSFWDIDGVYTGSATPGDVSDIAPVGDNVCLREDQSPGISLEYNWYAPDGSTAGSEDNVASGGDTIFAGNIQSFGSDVLLCGQFDVNANGTYQSATDHRYRMYGDSGSPETSGVVTATGDTIWATRYGSNTYALCVPISAITKITTGGTVTRNTISGFGEAATDVRDVKETSNGDVVMASSVTLYCYAQAGGAALWTASRSNIRRLACDASGNTYALSDNGSLRKYDSSGSVVWTVATRGIPYSNHLPVERPGLTRHTSLHIDSDGFVYVTGTRASAALLG